jgi:hydrogenase maturation protease
MSMSDGGAPRTLVIGLGNPLMGDDGFGLAVLAELRERWPVPDDVELVDGGTWGIRLLPLLTGAKRVLFLDAVDGGATPGTPFVLHGDELPRALCHKLSPHQIDLREVLALASFLGRLPRELVAVGAQPADVKLRSGLSPALEACVDDIARLAVRTLESWGHVAARVEGAPCQ